MRAGKQIVPFLAFFGVLVGASMALAAPQPVSAPPPLDACPDQGFGFYGFTGGYCLDKNREGVGYLTVSPHFVHVGEIFELVLYTDEGRGYAAQGTALFPSVHWNCLPNDLGCADTPFNPIVPGIRYADPSVSGPSTESNPVILFESVPCPGTADQCQDGWLKNSNSEGRLTQDTKAVSVLLKSIIAQVAANHDDIDTQDGLPFDDQVTAMNDSVKKAVKVGNKNFAKNKKDAKKKIKTFVDSLAVSRTNH